MNLRPHRNKLDLVVDITPLIDVVFLMLIFFMVSTSFNVATALKLDLPSSHASADKLKDKALVISIRADGQFFVNGITTSDRELRHRIMVASHNNISQRVIVRADSDTHHKRIVKALDTLQELGIQRVGIATLPAANSSQ